MPTTKFRPTALLPTIRSRTVPLRVPPVSADRVMKYLVDELRAGRLDLADLGDELGGWETSRLAELWEQLLSESRGRPSPYGGECTGHYPG